MIRRIEMSEYTTEELIKANRVHADLHAGCQECPLYEERVCTSPKLQTYSADRLEAQQKEISDLKKQIAETYTAEQFIHDADRIHECKKENEANIDIPMSCKEFVGLVKSWAASHPEKPKVTNGDKFVELYGGDVRGNHDAYAKMFDTDWWNAEYKEPSDK
jgi:hypothetical protein